MARKPERETYVGDETIGQGQDFALGEINVGAGIEPVAEANIAKAGDLEAFMNETLVIMVFEDNQEGSLPTVEPTVKGMKQSLSGAFSRRSKGSTSKSWHGRERPNTTKSSGTWPTHRQGSCDPKQKCLTPSRSFTIPTQGEGTGSRPYWQRHK